MSTPAKVQIPGKAVSVEDTDVGKPTRTLLETLNLQGTPEQADTAGKFGAAFFGPPQSVAVIEAGATAAAKWWAAGLGVSVLAAWGSVKNWWPKNETSIQIAALGGAALVTAILVAAIAYIIGSDVRGRAIASVATIEARAKVATAMIRAAEAAYTPAPAEFDVTIIPLPGSVRAKLLRGIDEEGWRAIALERQSDGSVKYILVKGSSEEKVSASELEFTA